MVGSNLPECKVDATMVTNLRKRSFWIDDYIVISKYFEIMIDVKPNFGEYLY